MPKKSRTKNPFLGRWRIVWMDQWDLDYTEEEAFIQFDARESGAFQFAYLEGEIDYRTSTRDSQPAVEFSWEGGDAADGTPCCGRGWAVLKGTELHGMLFIHQGDDSEFRAVQAGTPRRKRRK